MDNIIHEVTKGDFKRSSVPPMTHSVKATKIITISKPPLQEGSKSELRSDSNQITNASEREVTSHFAPVT